MFTQKEEPFDRPLVGTMWVGHLCLDERINGQQRLHENFVHARDRSDQSECASLDYRWNGNYRAGRNQQLSRQQVQKESCTTRPIRISWQARWSLCGWW